MAMLMQSLIIAIVQGSVKARSDQSTFYESLWRRDGTVSAHVEPVPISRLHIGQTAARISVHPPVPGAASPLVEQPAIGKNGSEVGLRSHGSRRGEADLVPAGEYRVIGTWVSCLRTMNSKGIGCCCIYPVAASIDDGCKRA